MKIYRILGFLKFKLCNENDFHGTKIYYDHSNCVNSVTKSFIGISSFSLSPNASYISFTSSMLRGKSPTFVKIALNSRLLHRFSIYFRGQETPESTVWNHQNILKTDLKELERSLSSTLRENVIINKKQRILNLLECVLKCSFR